MGGERGQEFLNEIDVFHSLLFECPFVFCQSFPCQNARCHQNSIPYQVLSGSSVNVVRLYEQIRELGLKNSARILNHNVAIISNFNILMFES